MRYFSIDYSCSTLVLLLSSFIAVLSLGTEDWSTAIWAFNTWGITMQLRSVIRWINRVAEPKEIKTDENGTES